MNIHSYKDSQTVTIQRIRDCGLLYLKGTTVSNPFSQRLRHHQQRGSWKMVRGRGSKWILQTMILFTASIAHVNPQWLWQQASNLHKIKQPQLLHVSGRCSWRSIHNWGASSNLMSNEGGKVSFLQLSPDRLTMLP